MHIEPEERLRKYKELLTQRRIIDGCWEWTGHFQNKKIPMTTWRKKSMTVRRCMFFLSYIVNGELGSVHSTCQNDKCFKPDHLSLDRPKMRKI